MDVIQSRTCSHRSSWSTIFGTGMEKVKISCTKTIGNDLPLNIFNIIWKRTMPFCEDSLFQKRFNHARPAAAAAIWASEGTTLTSGVFRRRLSPRKTRLCHVNVLSSPLSSMPRSTQASAQSDWPHQMAMSNKVMSALWASYSWQSATEKNCKSTPASSAERILPTDSFQQPSGSWKPKKNCPHRGCNFLGLIGSRWRTSCQSSNLHSRNKACGKGMSSPDHNKSSTMRCWKSAPAHKAVLAAFQQSSLYHFSAHRRRGRRWHFSDKLTAAFWLPVKMAMSNSRAIAFGAPLKGSSMSRLHMSRTTRVTGVAAASSAAVIASTRSTSQSSIQMPCSTGKAQEQHGHVFQPLQLQGPGQPEEETPLPNPRWRSDKMPRIAIAQAVSMRPNHRQRSNRCTIPHWDGSNWANSSWFGVWEQRWRKLTLKHHRNTMFLLEVLWCCRCGAGVVWLGHLYSMHVYCIHLYPCIRAPFVTLLTTSKPCNNGPRSRKGPS